MHIRFDLGTCGFNFHLSIYRGTPENTLWFLPGSPKMGYKANFSALEVYKDGRWQDLGDPEDHSAATHPLSTDPIAEQVARINLPDSRPVKG